MTYPMAYGWMKIKLDTFGLPGSDFDDSTDALLESSLKPWEEIDTSDQYIYEQVPIYFSSASYLLLEFAKLAEISGNSLLVEPSTANIILLTENVYAPHIGFSLGNRSFPEPYFFMQLADSPSTKPAESPDFSGIWNSKKNELVLMASDFITHNQDQEHRKVMNFFMTNFSKLAES